MFAALRSGFGHERRPRSLKITVWLVIVLGVAGLYIQQPPIQPPGNNPWNSSRPKKCPVCRHRVIPKRRGRCVCQNCGHRFMADEADDYRHR